MINGYLRYQASELNARVLPIHETALSRLTTTPGPAVETIRLRRLHDDLFAYLFDLKEIYDLCLYAWRTDGFVYLSSQTARRLESLTVENFERDWKRFCEEEQRAIAAQAAAMVDQEKDHAHEAVLTAGFIVFSFLIWFFSPYSPL